MALAGGPTIAGLSEIDLGFISIIQTADLSLAAHCKLSSHDSESSATVRLRYGWQDHSLGEASYRRLSRQ